jgi:hypothetical protein
MVPAGEPGHGDDVAGDGGGDDRPGAGHLGEAGAGCRDRGGRLRPGLAPPGAQVADAGRQLGGGLAARLGHRTGRGRLLADPGGLACGDLVRYPAGNQLTQHGLEPAGDLVAGPGKITMAPGPHRQHDGVAIGGHLLAARGPQRRHRRRPGIVRAGLVRVAGLQQPDPGSQPGLHIATRSPAAASRRAGSRPGPRAPFCRPGPLRPGPRPGNQPPGPVRAGPHPQPAQRLPGRAGRHRGARAPYAGRSRSSLPPVHSHPRQRRDRPRRACPIPDPRRALVPLPGHATARARRSRHIDPKPGTRPAGGSGASPIGPLRTLRQPQRPARVVPIRRFLVALGSHCC